MIRESDASMLLRVTAGDLEMLGLELARPDLQVYTVVQLAQQDLEAGSIESAVSRLFVDSDKLRMYETPINGFLSRLRE